MRVAVLSPHRDDAAFSCALTLHALLRAGAQVTVLNVFTRSDYAVDLRTVQGGQANVDAVSAARLLEDEAFLRDLTASAGREQSAATLHDLHWLDAPLRLTVATESVLESPLTPEQVVVQAAELATQLAMLAEAEFVFAPMALGDHIDHRVAREAARRCVPVQRLCWYEDLPYAARMSDEARRNDSAAALHQNGPQKVRRVAVCLHDGQHLRERFAMHYPSQIAPEVAVEMAVYAARWGEESGGVERWWASPATAEAIASALRPIARVEVS